MLKNALVIIVFYDLPVIEGKNRTALKFRKELTRNGYMFVQKSVYAKLVRNRMNCNTEMDWIQKVAPKDGDINALHISLNEFKQMSSIIGDRFNMDIFSSAVVEI